MVKCIAKKYNSFKENKMSSINTNNLDLNKATQMLQTNDVGARTKALEWFVKNPNSYAGNINICQNLGALIGHTALRSVGGAKLSSEDAEKISFYLNLCDLFEKNTTESLENLRGDIAILQGRVARLTMEKNTIGEKSSNYERKFTEVERNFTSAQDHLRKTEKT
ncbi:MAG: hypothetical protein K2X08_03620, partial [Chlamydiales bacterium]|nr:hypothetical protein [Chlamydiales bacterium]